MRRICSPVSSRLRSRRGMASALIIMLLVLLVFFSVLSLVTMAADYRLSQKRAAWNAGYYAADAEAVKVLGALDTYCLGLEGDSLQASTLADSLGELLDDAAFVQSWQIVPAMPGVEQALILNALVARDAASGQGIMISLRIRTGVVSQGEQRIIIEGWNQWQPEFDYSGQPGGIWKG